jgi:hypothetical protein
MLNLVVIKNGDFYYPVPMHEFSRYWLPLMVRDLDYIEVPRLPNDIPYASKLAALKRGKGVKRTIKAYEQKGSGKHDPKLCD